MQGDLYPSADLKHVSLNIPDPARSTEDVWIYEVARSLRTRFTSDPANENGSLWSPDGSQIVIRSNRKGHYDLYERASDGSGTEQLLLEDNFEKRPLSWSADGRFILYASTGGPTGSDLFVLPLSGDRKPVPFLQTPFLETAAEFSPDGRWVAYRSNESGRTEIYVSPFPGPGGRRQISTSGGDWPRWRGDGGEIFYLAPDDRLMAASVNGRGATFEVGAANPLFETRKGGRGHFYAVTADGQRFLINIRPEQAAPVPVTVVVNWTAGLPK